VAKNRVVAIKDWRNNLVKEWRFKDVPTVVGEMTCRVQELLNLKKGSTRELKLYYSSGELPKGRQLAIISFESSNTASLK
jgi:hypothetical protein